MKRKLLLIIAMVAVLACFFALAVSADVHSNVDKTEKVTLDDGTELNLFDSEGNALIWWRKGANTETGENIYECIRADDIEDGDNGKRVVYFVESNRGQTALAKVNIYSGGSIIGYNADIVVFNIMDDDIAFDTDPNQEGIQPMTKIQETFNRDNKNPGGQMRLEYAYLRLDTTQIGGKAFYWCNKLKYINISDLTELDRIGAVSGYDYGGTFCGCSSLFEGQVLDLSRTKLTTVGQGTISQGNFEGVPITGIKFPTTLTWLAKFSFNSCSTLKDVWFAGPSEVELNAFAGAVNLEKIYYVGSLENLNTFLSRVSKSNNAPFWDVVNANKIPYFEYEKLSDKSGKYLVYEYSSCSYNNVEHGTLNATANACIGICSVCGGTVVSHVNGNTSVTITYSNYAEEGAKTVKCNNEGCTYNATEKAPALFTCLGYSAPEDGRGGIAIGFTVNNVAIAEYEEATGKTLKYGVFAVLQDRLGNNDVFADDGTVADGVINADITSYEFVLFELKIVGFTDEYKDVKLAMGAYVAVTDGETTEYSYLQSGTPNENEKYCFVSYNDIVNTPSTDEEVTQ